MTNRRSPVRVIGDAVQHVADVAAARAGDDVGKVEPPLRLAGRRIDPGDRVGHEDVGEELALTKARSLSRVSGRRPRVTSSVRRTVIVSGSTKRSSARAVADHQLVADPRHAPARARAGRSEASGSKLLALPAQRDLRAQGERRRSRPASRRCLRPRRRAERASRRSTAPSSSRTSRSSERPIRPVLSNSRPSHQSSPWVKASGSWG